MVIVVTQVVGGADYAYFETVDKNIFTDSCVDNGTLNFGIASNKQEEVSIIQTSNMRVHHILATEIAIQLRSVAPHIDVIAVKAIKQILESDDRFNVLELSNYSLNIGTVYFRQLFGSHLHSLFPFQLSKRSVLLSAHRDCQSLLFEPVKSMASLI